MNHKPHGSTTILGVVCAIIFVIFSIHYIYSFQGDILGMMQYSWSDHETHYNRLIGSIIILGILYLITYLIRLFFLFPDRLRTLVYMPAMILMGQITAVTVDDSGTVTMPWFPAWISILLLIIYPFLIKGIEKIHTGSILPIDAERALQWLTNSLVLLVLIIMTNAIGNTDRNLHTRLAVERLCLQGHYAAALAKGVAQHDHGSGITMWRAMALSRIEKKDTVRATMLGEQLFTYNIDGDNRSILPRRGQEPRALLSDCPGTPRFAAKDYLLCTYLLRKDIAAFANTLPRYYNVRESLPQHYKEALVMYYSNPLRMSQMARDSVVLDSAMIEDYSDFQQMLHIRSNNTKKNATLRDNFFGTYWYYFFID